MSMVPAAPAVADEEEMSAMSQAPSRSARGTCLGPIKPCRRPRERGAPAQTGGSRAEPVLADDQQRPGRRTCCPRYSGHTPVAAGHATGVAWSRANRIPDSLVVAPSWRRPFAYLTFTQSDRPGPAV